MGYQIKYEYDSELDHLEYKMKSYRNDVSIIIGQKRYNVAIYSIVSFLQYLNACRREDGFYAFSEANLIIVNDVTKNDIEKTVSVLYRQNYFEELDMSVKKHNRHNNKDIEIIYGNDITLDNFNKDSNQIYFNDITIVANDKEVKVNITDAIRFMIIYEQNIYNYGYHKMMPNTIIVKEVCKEQIEKTIFELYEYHYFDKIGSTNYNGCYKNA